MKTAYFLIMVCVVTIAVGQLIFKYVSANLKEFSVVGLRSQPDLLALLVFAMALYAACTILWVIALRDLPLSRAYVFMALGFVIVPLGARFFFGEQLTPSYMIGALMIAIGIVVTVN